MYFSPLLTPGAPRLTPPLNSRIPLAEPRFGSEVDAFEPVQDEDSLRSITRKEAKEKIFRKTGNKALADAGDNLMALLEAMDPENRFAHNRAVISLLKKRKHQKNKYDNLLEGFRTLEPLVGKVQSASPEQRALWMKGIWYLIHKLVKDPRTSENEINQNSHQLGAYCELLMTLESLLEGLRDEDSSEQISREEVFERALLKESPLSMRTLKALKTFLTDPLTSRASADMVGWFVVQMTNGFLVEQLASDGHRIPAALAHFPESGTKDPTGGLVALMDIQKKTPGLGFVDLLEQLGGVLASLSKAWPTLQLPRLTMDLYLPMQRGLDYRTYLRKLGASARTEGSPATQRKAVLEAMLSPHLSSAKLKAAVPMALRYAEQQGDIDPVLALAKEKFWFDVPEERFEPLWNGLMQELMKDRSPLALEHWINGLINLQQCFIGNHEAQVIGLEILLEQPSGKRGIALEAFRLMLVDQTWINKVGDLRDPEKFRANLKLLARLTQPDQFLNFYLQEWDGFNADSLFNLYRFIDTSQYGVELGEKILPELMALLGPYARLIREQKVDAKNFLDMSSQALTRVFRYTQEQEPGGAINALHPMAFNNWADIGRLGLSFSKWKYDAMQPWKGQGPMEKPPFLVQSGLFKRIPPRPDDVKYHGGFMYTDPATGLAIEMRRAYVVISQPGLGSLVIRNSSHFFGRDLLPQPAYFHPTQVYSGNGEYFDPERELAVENPSEGYQSVLSRSLNQTYERQAESHQKIRGLLETFDSVMGRYVDWKCGFTNGKPSKGFEQLLRTSLLSAKDEGLAGPFGKNKNLRLAWVNPFGLPTVVKAFDVKEPKHLEELAFYETVLSRRTAVPDPAQYAAKIPNLLGFLSEGLKNGWELVLSETPV